MRTSNSTMKKIAKPMMARLRTAESANPSTTDERDSMIASEIAVLSDDEREWMAIYDRLPQDDRRLWLRVAQCLIGQMTRRERAVVISDVQRTWGTLRDPEKFVPVILGELRRARTVAP